MDIKNKLNIKISLPKKDLSGWKNDLQDFTVTTIFNTKNNTFLFRCSIPKYIYSSLINTDSQYLTNPPKSEHSWESKPKKFTKSIVAPTLEILIDEIQTISMDAIKVKENELADTEKYIAVRFTQSSHQKKDAFNFANMGELTKSEFQFFPLHKIIKSKDSLDQYNFKTKHRIGDSFGVDKEWYYYGINVIERNFKLVKWTQEREDFLTQTQNKFIELNEMLDEFLGDITDKKLISLMNNSNFLLNSSNE